MNELMTTDELCEKLKVSRPTIERYRKKGMPYKKVGRLVRFDAKEVMEWINAQK